MYRPLILCWMLLISGCASISIDQPATSNLDISQASSWRYWESNHEAQPAQPLSLDEQRVRQALENGLRDRGLTFSEQDDADLTLHYRLVDEVRLQGSGISYGFGFGRGPFGMGAMTDTDARAYREQRLILEVINPASHAVQWSATAQKYLTDSHSPTQRTKLITELIDDMLQALFAQPQSKHNAN